MTRTTVVPEAPDAALTGATILPGVPLPTWGRPAEPVLPDPPPAPPVPLAPPVEAAAPPPAPVPAPPPVVEFAAPAPALLDVAPTTPLEMPAPVETPAPVEPEVRQPRSHRRDAAGPVATAAVVTVGAQAGTDLLDVPVPQLAPPTPVPPRSEVYAAAGAAPPTAPWGAPPADPVDADPVDAVEMKPVDPVDAAEAAPVDLEDDDDHGADRPERPRRALLALGAFGGILVLGAVAAFVWPGFLVAEDQPAAAPRPAVSVATKVTLGAPDSAAGLSKISGAPAAALAKSAAGTDLTGYTSPVTAVYGTGTTPSATVIAWNATGHGAGADVSTAFAGYQQATGQPVTGIASAATGKLGGRMSCGSTVVGTTPASVCFWADDATFGAVTVLRPTDAKAGAATAVAIRTAMETRS